VSSQSDRDGAASEALAIRIHRSQSWLRKSRKAGKNNDLDAQFVFLWIAFNALYGKPRYRDDIASAEIRDFKEFLDAIEELSRGQVASILRRPDLEGHVEKVLQNPFLNIECWKRWDRAGIRDRRRRTELLCNTYDKGHQTIRVFLQLYTLRNQLLHGAATDAGRRNRESLRHAIPIADASVEALVGLVKKHYAKIPALEPVPYPPSIGDGGEFNTPRLRS
jgi:hypothetical protein